MFDILELRIFLRGLECVEKNDKETFLNEEFAVLRIEHFNSLVFVPPAVAEKIERQIVSSSK